MISEQLINPKSIVVVGGSDDLHKPGGTVLRNLQDGNFKGELYVVNPKMDVVQGIKSYRDVKDLPEVDCAVLAIAAKFCPATVEVLAKQKNTKGFIILSAGFHEENAEGAKLERQIVDTINSVGGSLIGPNCIGMLNNHFSGVFTQPIPELDPQGVDLISGSGATALFIMDSGMQKGIKFNSMYSVGNSAQLGVEDILEYLDESFDPAVSSRVKLLYVESIEHPDKLLKHASSLIRKGCRIAAIKSGGSAAGSRAASSHTGALASSDVAVEALFRKAGIVRCNGRDELMRSEERRRHFHAPEDGGQEHGRRDARRRSRRDVDGRSLQRRDGRAAYRGREGAGTAVEAVRRFFRGQSHRLSCHGHGRAARLRA